MRLIETEKPRHRETATGIERLSRLRGKDENTGALLCRRRRFILSREEGFRFAGQRIYKSKTKTVLKYNNPHPAVSHREREKRDRPLPAGAAENDRSNRTIDPYLQSPVCEFDADLKPVPSRLGHFNRLIRFLLCRHNLPAYASFGFKIGPCMLPHDTRTAIPNLLPLGEGRVRGHIGQTPPTCTFSVCFSYHMYRQERPHA